MACHVAPDRNVTASRQGADRRRGEAALADHIAYFGTYSVDERAATVTHHRQGSVQPGDKGDVVRGYEFVGDRLILRPGRHDAGSDMATDQVRRRRSWIS